ncbi:hypothetical protein E2C01_029952 [Portunus trituberculatus]|uniref:Uncharacterized protein n=1 Tax=Portunus trituberculatus TaxID=210409 RepID=A0A5B7EQR4_PORTR|nr:hypothetical protein [Portunus trituberculatus]
MPNFLVLPSKKTSTKWLCLRTHQDSHLGAPLPPSTTHTPLASLLVPSAAFRLYCLSHCAGLAVGKCELFKSSEFYKKFYLDIYCLSEKQLRSLPRVFFSPALSLPLAGRLGWWETAILARYSALPHLNATQPPRKTNKRVSLGLPPP